MGGGRVEIQWEPKVAQMKCLWFCEKGKAWWKWGVSVMLVMDVGRRTTYNCT